MLKQNLSGSGTEGQTRCNFRPADEKRSDFERSQRYLRVLRKGGLEDLFKLLWREFCHFQVFKKVMFHFFNK